MGRYLENMLDIENQWNFKSEGERRIAYFLDRNSIQYRYEPGVLINSAYEKPRIWYPDFYLPEFNTYIEYYGLAGRKHYDRGIDRKNTIYTNMGLDVMPIYPWMLSGNWQGYLMRELKRSNVRKYKVLMSKPYWRNRRNHYSHTLKKPHMIYRKRPHAHY